jgi:hypothetical protein
MPVPTIIGSLSTIAAARWTDKPVCQRTGFVRFAGTSVLTELSGNGVRIIQSVRNSSDR